MAGVGIQIPAGAVPGDRPLSIAPIPLFCGEQGADPDHHIAQFMTACVANNARTPQHWLTMFPATLRDMAFQWYDRQPAGTFADWDALRIAFLAQFRPLGFVDRLRERLQSLRMVAGESIDSYYGRMEDILRRWNNHQIPNHMLMDQFVAGLNPPELRIFVKEASPPDLQTAINRAKLWEVCHQEQFLPSAQTIITSQPYLHNQPLVSMPTLTSNHQLLTRQYPVGEQPLIPNQQVAQLPAGVSLPEPTGPPIFQSVSTTNPSTLAPIRNHYEDALLNMTKKLEELAVHMASNREKRPKPSNIRPNVWCTNCKGYGHTVNECPSPQNLEVRCSFCGGRHAVQQCWNLQPHMALQKPKGARTTWDVNQVGTNGNPNWRGNNSNRWGRGNNSRNNPGHEGYNPNRAP